MALYVNNIQNKSECFKGTAWECFKTSILKIEAFPLRDSHLRHVQSALATTNILKSEAQKAILFSKKHSGRCGT